MGEESRAQVASQQMPHLPKSNRLRVLHVHSVTASITVWRTAQVSRRLSKKERRLFKKQEYVFGCLRYGHVSRRCQNRKVCKTCSMPHPTVLHDESKMKTKHSSEDQARVVQ